MLRVVTCRETNKMLYIGTRDYCAECETPLCESPLQMTNANDYSYCPQCRSLAVLKEEILAVRVCPFCSRNVWNFKKSGNFEKCPHCKQEFISSGNTQPQPKVTTPRRCFSIFYP